MMTRRYLLSMLSVLPLIVAYDVVYFVFHRSLDILLAMGAMHFVLYGPLLLLGSWLLYRPIARGLGDRHEVPRALERVGRLTWNSTWLAGGVGLLTVAISLLPLFVLPELYAGSGAFATDRIPTTFVLASVPPGSYVFCIFPAFVTHFLINDFVLDLRARVYAEHGHLSSPGKKRIALTILSVLLVLGLIPLLLVILEYTVIGDAVNVAARLEQLNKQYGTAILAGETTVKLAGEGFPFVHVGEVQLKGKTTPSNVYGVDAQRPVP